jgi:hypothetical protein
MVAVAVGSRLYANVSDLYDLPLTLIDGIEQFFINYNKIRGRGFKSTARRGAADGSRFLWSNTVSSATLVTSRNENTPLLRPPNCDVAHHRYRNAQTRHLALTS